MRGHRGRQLFEPRDKRRTATWAVSRLDRGRVLAT